MRVLAIIAMAVTAATVFAGTGNAAPKKKHFLVTQAPPSTVIQPTRTIIHNADGTTTIIVTPRRSYLHPGTEVSVGDGSYRDYMLPPAGDPGRPDWWYGPDHSGTGGYPLATPFYLPGINTNTPF